MQVKSDFVVHGASPDECAARIRQLLWPGNESSASDFVAVDSLTINLATYQVNVAGEPLDLTYLEYALLAFLVTHPGRAYSRDALLRRARPRPRPTSGNRPRRGLSMERVGAAG